MTNRIMMLGLLLSMAGTSACSLATETTGTNIAPDLAGALAACQVNNGDTCVDMFSSCLGQSAACTFGGNSQTGWNGTPAQPMHVDELDCWFSTGPLAGETAKAVSTPGTYAAYACAGAGGAYPGAAFVVTGTW